MLWYGPLKATTWSRYEEARFDARVLQWLRANNTYWPARMRRAAAESRDLGNHGLAEQLELDALQTETEGRWLDTVEPVLMMMGGVA